MKVIFLQNADKKYVKLTVYMTHAQTRDTSIRVISKIARRFLVGFQVGASMCGVSLCVSPGSPRFLTLAQ